MGSRRRTVLILLAVSLVSTGLFIGLALDATEDATPALAPPAQQADDDPTGALDSSPRPGLVEEYPAGGTLGLIYWALAFVSGTVLLVSVLLVRREVRVEKSRMRRRRARRALARDIQEYRRTQDFEDHRHT